MTRGPSSSEALPLRGLPGAAAARFRDGLARGFTFLELLVVMGVMAVFFGLGIGYLLNIGRSAQSMQAASKNARIMTSPQEAGRVISDCARRCSRCERNARKMACAA